MKTTDNVSISLQSLFTHFQTFIFIYSVDIVMFSLTTRGNNKIITSYNFSRMDVNFNSGFSKQTFITVAT